LDHQNNFETLKIMSNAATNLSVLHDYFDNSTKLPFCIQLKF